MSEKQMALKRVLFTVVGCILVALVAILGLKLWQLIQPASGAEVKTIEVQVVHGDGSANDFILETEKENLGEALVEGEVVVDNQSTYGLYILTADGETANESNQEWWKITRGGESLNTGADSTPIADGEHYELTLTVGY